MVLFVLSDYTTAMLTVGKFSEKFRLTSYQLKKKLLVTRHLMLDTRYSSLDTGSNQ